MREVGQRWVLWVGAALSALSCSNGSSPNAEPQPGVPLGGEPQPGIWLGRTDFRLIETNSDGSQTFLRRQFEGTVALRTLLDASLEPVYRRIDDTVTAFVGEHDYMVIDEVTSLLSDLGVQATGELAALPDAKIAQAVIAARVLGRASP